MAGHNGLKLQRLSTRLPAQQQRSEQSMPSTLKYILSSMHMRITCSMIGKAAWPLNVQSQMHMAHSLLHSVICISCPLFGV